jgi:hypothetical protein
MIESINLGRNDPDACCEDRGRVAAADHIRRERTLAACARPHLGLPF